MVTCKICKKPVPDGIHLSDGGLIHESCFELIQAAVVKIEGEINDQQRIKDSLALEINRRYGLLFKLKTMFSKPSIDLSELEKKLIFYQIKISDLYDKLDSLKKTASQIYDLILTYPPDWDYRREKVIERDGNRCSNCGEHTHLHLHHLVSLSKGGNNKIENLKLLCADCHSEEHGERIFTYSFSDKETAFSKRISNIYYAIKNSRQIKFDYKKPTDTEHHQRVVTPTELINVDHVRDSGTTLCVRGYCELRQAERTFALKRMRGLKVI